MPPFRLFPGHEYLNKTSSFRNKKARFTLEQKLYMGPASLVVQCCLGDSTKKASSLHGVPLYFLLELSRSSFGQEMLGEMRKTANALGESGVRFAPRKQKDAAVYIRKAW